MYVMDSLEGGVRGAMDQNPLSAQVGILAVTFGGGGGGGISGNGWLDDCAAYMDLLFASSLFCFFGFPLQWPEKMKNCKNLQHIVLVLSGRFALLVWNRCVKSFKRNVLIANGITPGFVFKVLADK